MSLRYWPHVVIAALLFATAPARAQELVIAPGQSNSSQPTSPPSQRIAPRYAVAQDAPVSARQAKPRKAARRAPASQQRVQPVPAAPPPDVEAPPPQRAETQQAGDRATASEIQNRVAGTQDPAMAKYYADGWRPAGTYPNVIDHLPFTLYANQTVTYNDNILLTPNNAVLPPWRSRGDLYSLTSIGASTRIPIAAQQLFFDGTYGFTRYRKNTSLDSENYLVNGGLDWVFTERCAGRLVATARQVQAPIEELTSFNNNDIETVSGKETAKCRLNENFNVTFDSGLSRTRNSLGNLKVNDNEQFFLRGGIEYSLAELNTIGARVGYTDTDYVNRSATLTPGLATGLEQTDYAFYLRRTLTPVLEFDGSIGFTESKTISPLSTTSFTKPTYAAALRWQATPVLFITASWAQTIAPPQNIIADFERIRTESISATYIYSPVLSFTGSLGQSRIENPTSSGVAATTLLRDQTLWFADLRANWQITPLTSAMFQYRYTNRKDEMLDTTATSNLYMVSLNYRR
jgi:hypothetical protein